MRYAGWASRETLQVALWLQDDPDACQSVTALAMNEARDPEGMADFLAHEIKKLVEEGAPDLGATVYSDLLRAALSEVHWIEVASAWFEVAQAEVRHEDEETAA